MSLKNESRRLPAKILIPCGAWRTWPTGALGGVMILPGAVRLVASAPVSCATVTCWLPLAPGWVKVNRQVMSAT